MTDCEFEDETLEADSKYLRFGRDPHGGIIKVGEVAVTNSTVIGLNQIGLGSATWFLTIEPLSVSHLTLSSITFQNSTVSFLDFRGFD